MFNKCGIPVLLALLYLCALPAGVHAWTSAGPWGGVIHDMVNSPAGGDTLFAGTANGIYRHNTAAAGPWDTFSQTLGYRVLQVLPDPANQKAYAIVRESDDSFDYSDAIWSGELYELDLSTGNFSSIFGTPASSMAFCGGGDLLVSTFDEEWLNGNTTEIEGYIYRRSGGGGWTKVLPYDFNLPWPPPTDVWTNKPILALHGEAGSSTVYMIRQEGSFSDILISQNGGACGTTWYIDQEFSGLSLTAMGQGPSGELLAGTEGGTVYGRNGAGTWQTLGTGLPSYPVTGFASGASLTTPTVLLRKHYWNNTANPAPAMADPRGGFYSLQTGVWEHLGTYDYVTSRVNKAAAVNGDLWVAYEDAGIWRYPSGLTPGEERDEGIAAVNLAGLVIDPRSEDRALAYGPSGVYERRDGEWRRLLMLSFGTVVNTSDYFGDVVQDIRERGFHSGAVSFDDPGDIWVGGMDVAGLVKGRRMSPGSWDYAFDQVYFDTGGAANVTDILVDPFNSDKLWFSAWSEEGIYESDDGGTTYLSATDHLPDTTYKVNDLETDYLEPAARTLLAAKDTETTFGESGLLVCEAGGEFDESGIYTNLKVGALSFNPQDLGQKRAVVGPTNSSESMAVLSTTSGSWNVDTTVGTPSGLPSARIFADIAIPLGYDADDIPDAFSVVSQNGTEYWGLFSSTAQTTQGTPGETWVEPASMWEIEVHRPNSVTVDTKDGNLLWVTTHTGSAYTMRGDHYSDLAPPSFPLASELEIPNTADILAGVADTIELAWMAPGDDGDMPGWADRYILYFRTDHAFKDTADINDVGVVTVSGLPAPHISHREESWSIDISSYSDTQFFLALVAYDEQDQVSALLTAATNPQAAGTDDPPPGSGGGGGGGGCFIATAAYGSVLEPEVDLLRRYRDGYLLNRTWGRKLVDIYYSVSPEPARFISGHPTLRSAVRGLLYPIITAVKISGRQGVMPVAAGIVVLLLPMALSGAFVVVLVPGFRRRMTALWYARRGIQIN